MNKPCAKPGCNEPKWSTASMCQVHHKERMNNSEKSYGNPQQYGRFHKKYNMTQTIGVYGWKMNDIFIYIGESTCLPKRRNEHLTKSTIKSTPFWEIQIKDREQFEYFVLWEGPKEYRLEQEKELIKLHDPKYNKI